MVHTVPSPISCFHWALNLCGKKCWVPGACSPHLIPTDILTVYTPLPYMSCFVVFLGVMYMGNVKFTERSVYWECTKEVRSNILSAKKNDIHVVESHCSIFLDVFLNQIDGDEHRFYLFILGQEFFIGELVKIQEKLCLRLQQDIILSQKQYSRNQMSASLSWVTGVKLIYSRLCLRLEASFAGITSIFFLSSSTSFTIMSSSFF